MSAGDRVQPRRAFWLAGFAGMSAVLLAASAAWLARDVLIDADAGHGTLLRTPRAQVAQAPAVATAADTASLRRLRAIAASHMRAADRALATCPYSGSARGLALWMDCAQPPVGHLDVSSRLNASILYAIAQRLPPGQCRDVALGRSNEMTLLADAAHQVQIGGGRRSAAGRREMANRIAVLRGLIHHMRGVLRRHEPDCTTARG